MGPRERYSCLQELAWWWKMAVTTALGPDSIPVLFAASRIRWQSKFFSRLQCSPCARQLLQQMAGPPGRSIKKIPLLSSLLRVGASLPLPWLCYWLGMTENPPQGPTAVFPFLSSPSLAYSLSSLSWILCRTGSLGLVLWAHSLLKELFVPDLESQKSALSLFSLSSLVSKFSSKVAKTKQKQLKNHKRNQCSDGEVPSTLTAQTGCLWWRSRCMLLCPGTCAHSVVWCVTVFILKRWKHFAQRKKRTHECHLLSFSVSWYWNFCFW